MSKYNVTVGIPMVREPLSQIELAVRSVYAQTFADWELVFFADGSPDEHIDLLRSIDDPRVRIIVNESSQGIASSLNRLADIADGKYIAILAADDMWTPQRLAIQVARLEEDDAPDVLAAQMVIISDDETVEGAQKPARIQTTRADGSRVPPSRMRRLWRVVSGFDHTHTTSRSSERRIVHSGSQPIAVA